MRQLSLYWSMLRRNKHPRTVKQIEAATPLCRCGKDIHNPNILRRDQEERAIKPAHSLCLSSLLLCCQYRERVNYFRHKFDAEAMDDDVRGDFVPTFIIDRLKDDPLIKYFRKRFDERERYLLSELKNAVGDDDKKAKMKIEARRIEEELQRIEISRERFMSASENKELKKNYDDSRLAWRRYAIEKSKIDLRDMGSRMKEMYPKPKDSSRKENREKWERRIIREIQEKWKQRIEDKEAEEKLTLQKNEVATRNAPASNATTEASGISENGVINEKNVVIEVAKTSENGDINEMEAQTVEKPKRQPPPPRPEDSYGLTMTKITLERSAENRSYMKPVIKKYPLNECLFNDKNILREQHGNETIRYFHIPVNNMHWIEVNSLFTLFFAVLTLSQEAIARYYGEDTPGEYNYRQHQNYLKLSSNLLCRKFWTSLQHGGDSDPAHARYMRANCFWVTPGMSLCCSSPNFTY
jgi:hypothetical protein